MAGGRVPSAQKAIEMGEESVKLGVTEDCALRYMLVHLGTYFIFPIYFHSDRIKDNFSISMS